MSMLAKLRAWLPARSEMRADLAFVPAAAFDYERQSPWRNMTMHYYGAAEVEAFNGYEWSRATATAWWIPLTAVALYACMVLTFRPRERVAMSRAVACWNFALGLFSLCGVRYCAPVLLHELWANGFYFTACAPAPWYGAGTHGLFVALFIYSKLFELLDTAILLLGKRAVISLHWWHHGTVLLYCWHSYAAQIATGLWFAAMNYFVHSVMYLYFACSALPSLRRRVKPYAIYVTLLQLAQMVGGIYVTVAAVLYQADGRECAVNKTNSILGLCMYASYFLLFAKLFADNYLGKKRVKAA